MTYLRIQQLLKERGISQKELAEYLGVTENSISMILSGKRQPRFETLELIAQRLDVPLWKLFKGSEDAAEGFVEYRGQLYRIQDRQDLEGLLAKMD